MEKEWKIQNLKFTQKNRNKFDLNMGALYVCTYWRKQGFKKKGYCFYI